MNLIYAEVIEVLSEPEYKEEVFEDSTYSRSTQMQRRKK